MRAHAMSRGLGHCLHQQLAHAWAHSVGSRLTPAPAPHSPVLVQDRDLWVASVGDSRALLLTRPPKSPCSLLSKAQVSWLAKPYTLEHP